MTLIKMEPQCLWCGSHKPVNSIGACVECTHAARLAADGREMPKLPATITDWLFVGMLIMICAFAVGTFIWTVMQ